MNFHPAADLFPLLPVESQEFGELAADIRATGLLETIKTHDGMILDGRNRFRACQHVGIAPRFEAWTGESPVGYVLSVNLRRRHLTDDQRAAVAAEALPMLEAEAEQGRRARISAARTETEADSPPSGPGASRRRAAEQFSVSTHQVRQAKKVRELSPDRHEEVKAGRLPLAAAATEVSLEQAYERYPFIKDAPDLPPAAAIDMARTLDKAPEERRGEMVQQASRWCEVQSELEPERQAAREILEAGRVVQILATFNTAANRHGTELIAQAIMNSPQIGHENSAAILDSAHRLIGEVLSRIQRPIRRIQ